MPVDILVPPLSQTMDSLVLVGWLKKVGDPVTKGEALFTVETDKATLEVESPASGILQAVLAEPGDEIKVRSVIGSIAESVAEAGKPTRIFATPRARRLAQQENLDLEALRGKGSGPEKWIIERDVQSLLGREKEQPRATPVAKRMAEAAGVDLASLTPEQPGARIKKADVQSAIQAEAEPALKEVPAAPGVQKKALSPIRKTISRRMMESHANTAPVTYMSEVDATRLVKLRKRLLDELPEGAVRPTITDFLVFITARALLQHPELNATFDGETLEIHASVDMGLAVDTERGLIVPVLRGVESKSLFEIAQAREVLVRRTLAAQVAPEELSGGTFTLTNLGTLGVDHFTPIINPPQVAVLGVGRIRQVPVARKKKVKIRSVLGLAVTCDHRFIDGAPAARFLQEIASGIEKPHRTLSL
jgi:pyruvate dehydrogenase E2 component (dihydrolipoamide acetyltransferase)